MRFLTSCAPRTAFAGPQSTLQLFSSSLPSLATVPSPWALLASASASTDHGATSLTNGALPRQPLFTAGILAASVTQQRQRQPRLDTGETDNLRLAESNPPCQLSGICKGPSESTAPKPAHAAGSRQVESGSQESVHMHKAWNIGGSGFASWGSWSTCESVFENSWQPSFWSPHWLLLL
jgi:hypothetical protein